MGIGFYNQCIIKKIKTKYLDDDGYGVKPKHSFTKMGTSCSFGYSSREEMWDIDLKISKENFGIKRNKPEIFILLRPNTAKLKAI